MLKNSRAFRSFSRSFSLPRTLHFGALAFGLLSLCTLAIATCSLAAALGFIGFGLSFAGDPLLLPLLLPSTAILLLLCTILFAACGAVFSALSLCCSRACASL